MTHTLKIFPLLISLLAAFAGTAHGTQPPDSVKSDGDDNTAMGVNALLNWSTGLGGNTAAGANPLYSNTTGTFNTAFGAYALFYNVTGSSNTASGYESLIDNTASNNTGLGFQALLRNTTGIGNTATGYEALSSNVTGERNAAYGSGALQNSTGSYNIALGWSAGSDVVTGSKNIDIGNLGVSGESGTIRIGSSADQTATYIAGIVGSKVSGSAVYITSAGQLGVAPSSERYKTDIAAMGSSTGKLGHLRPVTFRLKNEPQGALQYGLIAEEVDKVYPELVIRSEAGKIEGIRYEELAPMLLNEMQRQQRELTAQAQQLHDLHLQFAELSELKQQLAAMKALNQSVQASSVRVKAKNEQGERL